MKEYVLNFGTVRGPAGTKLQLSDSEAALMGDLVREVKINGPAETKAEKPEVKIETPAEIKKDADTVQTAHRGRPKKAAAK